MCPIKSTCSAIGGASNSNSLLLKRLTLAAVLLTLPWGLLAAPAPMTKAQPNLVPDLLLPPETQWNHFAPELIPDFTIPTRFDPVLGTNMPVKILIWHTVGRNLFRTVTNGTEKQMFDSERVAMLNKGVSVFNYNCMRPAVEHVPRGGNPSNSVGLPLNPLTQVVVGDGTHDVGDKGDWNKWIAWWERNVDAAAGPLGAARPGQPSPIYMTCADYEGTYTAGTDQNAANHLVVGTYAMLDRTLGYAGQMYLGPLNTLGYTPEDIYKGGHQTFAWFKPSNDKVPEKYQGKKMADNPRIPASFEIAFSYESLLPEGYQAKDQNNKDFFVVSHFGKNPNTEHWAARVGSHVECSYQYTKPGGQKLIPMLKTVLERYGAYQYSPERDSKRWIKEFNRYGITQPGPNNTEFKSTIGSEFVAPFIAEAEMLLACFGGADGITYWGSAFGNDIPAPRPRQGNPQRGQKHNDPAYGNLDLESMNYVLKAFWRMAQKVTLENGKSYSFYDICDGREEYLNWNTQVSYDDGRTFAGVRAIDWQLDKKTAVRAVVNRKKQVIFILAFQPYGVEQSQVAVRYGEHGANFRQVIDVPARQVVIGAFELKGVQP